MRPTTKAVMLISGAGLLGIAAHEDFKSVPYKDSAGVWTDGFGNTRNVNPNRHVSVLSGLQTLHKNVSEFEAAINKCVTVPMYQYEFDALVDAAFNLGAPTVCNSSMVKQLIAGNYAASCEAYMLYDKIKVNGKYVSCRDRKYNCYGIIERREKERNLCYGKFL